MPESELRLIKRWEQFLSIDIAYVYADILPSENGKLANMIRG